MDGLMMLALIMAEAQLQEDAKRFDEQQKKKAEKEGREDIKMPWDLLTKDKQAAIEGYMRELGSLADHVDKNYIALIMLLSKYEDISIDAKVKLYLANKIAQKSST